MDIDPVTARILGAAAEEFGAHGFAGARVDEIAARAGVNKATLYYRIGEKDRLYAAVFGQMVDDLVPRMKAAAAAEPDTDSKIRAIARLVVRAAREHPFFPPLILREVASGGATLPDDVLRRISVVFGTVAGVIDEGIATGAFRRVDPVVTHMLLVGSLLFLVSATPIRERIRKVLPRGTVPKDEPAEEHLVDQVASIVLRGIAAPGPRRTGGRHARKS